MLKKSLILLLSRGLNFLRTIYDPSEKNNAFMCSVGEGHIKNCQASYPIKTNKNIRLKSMPMIIPNFNRRTFSNCFVDRH